jgi:hypothetical protein
MLHHEIIKIKIVGLEISTFVWYTVKKIIFPVPSGMSLTKLSQGWNNLIIPSQGEFGW